MTEAWLRRFSPSQRPLAPATASRAAALWLPLVRRAPSESVAQPLPDPGFPEICLWALCIFFLTSPFTFTLTSIDPTATMVRNLGTMRRSDDSQLLLYAVRGGMFAIAALFALRRWETAIRAIPRFLAFAPFLLWAAATMLWTDSVDSTLHGLIAQTLLLLTAFFVSVQISPRYMSRALVYSGVIMAMMSTVWAVFLPYYGIHQHNDVAQAVHAGSWRGVYLHKNALGQTAALYAAAIFFSGRIIVQSPFVKWAMFGLMLVMIVLSTSASALAIVPATIFLVWLTVILDPLRRGIATIYSVAAGIVGFLSINAVLAALGRDMTFSGRTTVWSVALTSIGARPMTGYGYMSITYGDFSYELFRRMGVIDPHNAYFDVILGTGFIGFVIFLLLIGRTWSISRRLYLRGGADRQGALVLYAMFVAWLVASLTESNDRPFTPLGALGFAVMSALFAIPMRRRIRASRRAEASTEATEPSLLEIGDSAELRK